MAETAFTPPTSASYPAVFTLVRESLNGALPDIASQVLDGIARTVAAKMDERQLAPAAYGDKRRPHYTHAAIGCDGVSVNLCFADGSAEFVFAEEELDFIREEGRGLYVARVAASEILALRQSLIDYLPAAEEVEDRATPAPPSLEAMRAAVELEIQSAIGTVTTRGIGELIDRVAEARVREALAQGEVARG